MIAEAIDTVWTLGWALLAWIALTAAFGVLGLYAVAVGVWAVGRGLWRCVAPLSARMPHAGRCTPAGAPRGPFRLPRRLRGAPEPAQGRVWLRSARVPRPDSAATGPSRSRGRDWSAAQASGGGFPVPSPQRPSQARPAPSWARTDKEAA